MSDKEQIAALTAQCADWKAKCEALTMKADDDKAKADAKQKEWADAIQAEKDKASLAESEARNHRDINGELARNVAKLQADNAKLAADVQAAKAETDAVRLALGASDSIVTQLNRGKADAKRLVDDLTAAGQGRESRIAALTQEVATLTTTVTALETRNRGLLTSVQELAARVEHAEAEKAEMGAHPAVVADRKAKAIAAAERKVAEGKAAEEELARLKG